MPLDRIIFKRNFQISDFLYRTVGVEGFINEGETAESLLNEAERVVEEWHRNNHAVLRTDYFKGPEPEIQTDVSKIEKETIIKIRKGIEQSPSKPAARLWVESHYPDYLDHVTVKTLIQIKKDK